MILYKNSLMLEYLTDYIFFFYSTLNNSNYEIQIVNDAIAEIEDIINLQSKDLEKLDLVKNKDDRERQKNEVRDSMAELKESLDKENENLYEKMQENADYNILNPFICNLLKYLSIYIDSNNCT